MKRFLQFVILLTALAWCVPSHAAVPTLVGGCIANAANNCTWATIGGTAPKVGDFLYYFAFRTATIAPTAPGSTTNLDTASASVSSFRSGCQVLTSATPATITATNATSIYVAIYHGVKATSTATCVTGGVGFHTSAGTSGTTSTYTFTGGTLTVTNGSSLIIGSVGSSAAPCTPGVFTAEQTGTNIIHNDIPAGSSSYSTQTCTGTTGNWKTDVVELLAATCNGTALNGTWSCVQPCNNAATATSVTCAFTNNTGTGDLIYVYGASKSLATTTSFTTGSCSGVTLTAPDSQFSNVNTTALAAYGTVATGGSCTITFNSTTSASLIVLGAEYSGGTANDGHGIAVAGGSGANRTSANITTTGDGNLVIASLEDDSNSSGCTYSAGTGYSLITNNTGTNCAGMEAGIQASHGSVTPPMTVSATGDGFIASTMSFLITAGSASFEDDAPPPGASAFRVAADYIVTVFGFIMGVVFATIQRRKYVPDFDSPVFDAGYVDGPGRLAGHEPIRDKSMVAAAR